MKVEVQDRVSGRMHSRDLLVDGQSVSHLVVRDTAIWLLGVQVRTGGIGGVGTPREHRRKGYSRRLMEDTLGYMRGLGQDVSMLFGIPDFYDKFGYAPCLPEHLIRVATRDAERTARQTPEYRARPVRPDDHPSMVRLYNRDNRARPGALVRSEDAWRGFRMGSSYHVPASALLLEDADGEPVAYAAFDESTTEVNVIEVTAADPRFFPCVLREMSAMAVDLRCGHIQLHAPPDHPFALFVRRCGCRVQTDYARMSGGMMRILNQDALFGKLEPALAERIGHSRFAGSRVELRIETDLGASVLRLGTDAPGSVPVEARMTLPQHALMQLMVGYRHAADVLTEAQVESRGEVEGLLDVLFGGRSPYVWRADRF